MRVFTIPASVPFLRTLVTALVDGRLVEGFSARTDPTLLASATLYLPTSRASRMVREIFLDVLDTDAVELPRIFTLGSIDEDEIGFAEDAGQFGSGRRGNLEKRRRDPDLNIIDIPSRAASLEGIVS